MTLARRERQRQGKGRSRQRRAAVVAAGVAGEAPGDVEAVGNAVLFHCYPSRGAGGVGEGPARVVEALRRKDQPHLVTHSPPAHAHKAHEVALDRQVLRRAGLTWLCRLGPLSTRAARATMRHPWASASARQRASGRQQTRAKKRRSRAAVSSHWSQPPYPYPSGIPSSSYAFPDCPARLDLGRPPQLLPHRDSRLSGTADHGALASRSSGRAPSARTSACPTCSVLALVKRANSSGEAVAPAADTSPARVCCSPVRCLASRV